VTRKRKKGRWGGHDQVYPERGRKANHFPLNSSAKKWVKPQPKRKREKIFSNGTGEKKKKGKNRPFGPPGGVEGERPVGAACHNGKEKKNVTKEKDRSKTGKPPSICEKGKEGEKACGNVHPGRKREKETEVIIVMEQQEKGGGKRNDRSNAQVICAKREKKKKEER